MIFKDRVSQHPNRRKLIKLDENKQPIDDPIIVDIERDDVLEGVTQIGEPVTADKLNKGNWRDDKSLSFTKLGDGEQDPAPSSDKTQIFTRRDRSTWLLAPESTAPVEIGTSASVFSTDLPKALGTASAGSSNIASRSDHIHQLPTAEQLGANPAITSNSFTRASTSPNTNVTLAGWWVRNGNVLQIFGKATITANDVVFPMRGIADIAGFTGTAPIFGHAVSSFSSTNHGTDNWHSFYQGNANLEVRMSDSAGGTQEHSIIVTLVFNAI